MVKHTAVFSFRSGMAREIYHALAPEMEEINPRSGVRVTLDAGDLLVISVAAEDIPALRAALNMWLRLVSVAGEMLEMTGNRGDQGQRQGQADEGREG
jgi:KEOPS complex subunit Pcc1